jgi:heptosyltransferase-2
VATEILLMKTAALGDVLRTTSILPGLVAKLAQPRITWLTARGARDLVAGHRLVDEVVTVDPDSVESVEAAGRALAEKRWAWVISLDDEEALCALASRLPCERLSGAYLDPTGARRYTSDVAPWFDMGLLSKLGKQEADRLKVVNRRSHPEIFASMLGLAIGRPELALDARAESFGREFARRHGLGEAGPVVGLNTGAGGRWPSKELTVDRTVELVARLATELGERAVFVLFGGLAEEARNAAILRGLGRLAPRPRCVDAGTRNSLLEFAALVSLCDLLVASDSLALHVAIARGTHVVCFFAPTSAAEIELYDLGEKVVSTAPDACSYRPDVDTATLTPERLAEAALRVLSRARPKGRRTSDPTVG